jgi:hypothetical protein
MAKSGQNAPLFQPTLSDSPNAVPAPLYSHPQDFYSSCDVTMIGMLWLCATVGVSLWNYYPNCHNCIHACTSALSTKAYCRVRCKNPIDALDCVTLKLVDALREFRAWCEQRDCTYSACYT